MTVRQQDSSMRTDTRPDCWCGKRSQVSEWYFVNDECWPCDCVPVSGLITPPVIVSLTLKAARHHHSAHHCSPASHQPQLGVSNAPFKCWGGFRDYYQIKRIQMKRTITCFFLNIFMLWSQNDVWRVHLQVCIFKHFFFRWQWIKVDVYEIWSLVYYIIISKLNYPFQSAWVQTKTGEVKVYLLVSVRSSDDSIQGRGRWLI